VVMAIVSGLMSVLTPAIGAAARPASDAPPRSGQWSMHMNGPSRLGRSPYVGPQTANLLWRIPTSTNYGGPVIGADGTVYMGTGYGELLAIRPDGSIKWRITGLRDVEMTPAILPGGRIVFVNVSGTIYVVNPDGTFSWHFKTNQACGCPDAAPAVGPDGTIYAAWFEDLYALTSDGSLKWKFDLSGHSQYRVLGPVSVGPDGTVYLASKYLFALSPAGKIKWQSADLFAPGGSPTVAPDGTIYANSYYPAALWAFNHDGTVRWTHTFTDCCEMDVPATPALGADGTIYVGETTSDGTQETGTMFAVNPDGSEKWRFSGGGAAPTSAAVGADGTIYYGSGSVGETGIDPAVFALNPDGTLKWQYQDPEGGGYLRTPPAIGKGRRLYAASFQGFLAFGPG
jgi:outer membrane protein assembly factor BamB